jgi:hypothetical protein
LSSFLAVVAVATGALTSRVPHDTTWRFPSEYSINNIDMAGIEMKYRIP